MKKNRLVLWLRWIGLAAILAYVTREFYLHQVLGGHKAASVHALCPFGALESLYNLLFAGAFIQKIYVSALIMLILTIVIAILFRRSFCGMICPFGALQEFFAKIGNVFFKKRPKMPSSLDKPLRMLKYLILILTIAMAWKVKGLWMSPYDPYAAYSHIFSGFSHLWAEYMIGTILLVVTIVGSIIYDRFFCKYLCPMGGFLAIMGRISPTKVVRDDKVCIHCNKCTKVCPVNIDVAKATEVKQLECISCNECVNICPKEGAIAVKFGKKPLSQSVVWVTVLILFFGSIFVTQKLGWYTNIPKPIVAGEKLAIEEIRGFMTLQDISIGLPIDMKELYTKLGIPETVPPTTKFKELSQFVPGMTDEKAKEILEKEQGQNPTNETSTTNKDVDEKQVTNEKEKEPAKEPIVLRGSMSLTEIAKILNISIEDLYQRLKLPQSVPPSTILKQIPELVPGFDFEAEKEKLQNNP